MTDQEFREHIISSINRLEERSEKHFDAMEQHFEKHMDSMGNRFETRLESMDSRLGSVARDVGWIKGKLEGKQETGTALWSRIAVGAAIASTIIALIALLT